MSTTCRKSPNWLRKPRARSHGRRVDKMDETKLYSWFLGPKAENADLLERLVLEALRDCVFWRRNFHPEDDIIITEKCKREDAFQDSLALVRQEFLALLANLKRDIPFYSPRYIGHMQETFENALRCLRPGGTLSSLGVYSGKLQVPYDAFAAGIGDYRITTTLCPGGRERMRRLMEVVRGGRVDFTPLLTHTFSLDEIREGYRVFGERIDGALKVAIKPL